MNLAAGISTTAPGSEGLASRGWAAPCLFISQEETFISAIGMSVKCRQEGTFGQALLYISELMATQIAPAGALPARGGIASKISGGEAIEAFPLSRRACSNFFRVRCSANRSGDPIVAGKRANSYAINYPELQAWIEMAHRPLIEVNDSARS